MVRQEFQLLAINSLLRVLNMRYINRNINTTKLSVKSVVFQIPCKTIYSLHVCLSQRVMQWKAISLTLCLDDNMGTTDTSRDASTF